MGATGNTALILPGRLPETHGWARQLCGKLGHAIGPSEIAEYAHWISASLPDVPGEAGKLADRQPTWIIAKSMGTLIACFAHAAYCLKGRKAVFIGSPVRAYTAEDAERLVRFCADIPTLFIQQTADYTGSFAQIQTLTQDCVNCERAEIPGNDHVYGDFEVLVPLIADWIGVTVPPS